MRLLAAGLALLVAACAGVELPPPTAGDLPPVRARYADASLEGLEQGRALYRSRCSRCHVAYAPTRYSADEWPQHIEEMRERAGIDAGQSRLILHYVSAIAERQPTH